MCLIGARCNNRCGAVEISSPRILKACNSLGITISELTLMTMTVKLDAPLERSLRKRSAEKGLSASVLIREALRTYLAQTEPPVPSAFVLGEDLFGRYGGAPTLASERKAELVKVWAEKRPDASKNSPKRKTLARSGKG
jgi:hypothetical protein